jgi:hypothetical protein
MTRNEKRPSGFIKQYQDWRYWYVGGRETALSVALRIKYHES